MGVFNTKIVSSGGVSIATDHTAHSGFNPSVVLLHGGGQTRHSWGKIFSYLDGLGYFVVNMDMRGHGESEWSPIGGYTIDDYVEDLASVILHYDIKPVLVGASLGGLTSLVLAAERIDIKVSGLVLVDVAPKISVSGVEEIKVFMGAYPDGFESLDEASDAVARYLPHRKRPPKRDGLKQSLRKTSDGRLKWHWDPRILPMIDEADHILREEARFVEATGKLDLPTLLIRGSNSRLLTEEGVRTFRKLMPSADYAEIKHAEHMVAGDANDAFSSPLVSFLEKVFN